MKKLSFSVNKELDKQMAEAFLNTRGGGVDFGKNIIKIHPKLKPANSNEKQRKNIISDYFDIYYRENKADLLRKTEKVKSAWRKHEHQYVRVTEKLFGGFLFPPGKYVAYPSIIDCNPRFLDTKTFQFFYRKPIADAIYVIAHELLHFIFFDFIEKKMKDKISELTENQIWDLSEVFNVIVLRSNQYRLMVNPRRVLPYPDHKKYLWQFTKAYKNSPNIKEFIQRGINIIKRGGK